MGNRSMTLESWFYLKAYCTASGRRAYWNSGDGAERSTAGVNRTVKRKSAATGARAKPGLPSPVRFLGCRSLMVSSTRRLCFRDPAALVLL